MSNRLGVTVSCDLNYRSNLFPKEAIAAKDWNAITKLSVDALAIIKEVR